LHPSLQAVHNIFLIIQTLLLFENHLITADEHLLMLTMVLYNHCIIAC